MAGSADIASSLRSNAIHVSEGQQILEGQPQRDCCMGSAVYGPTRCTCWEIEYDQPQQPLSEAETVTRSEMCADCAFRPDSPERTGDERYNHSDDISVLTEPGRTFVCHQGMRRAIALIHPDDSTRISLEHLGSYKPTLKEGLAYKADGTPADRCTGWAARSETTNSKPAP